MSDELNSGQSSIPTHGRTLNLDYDFVVCILTIISVIISAFPIVELIRTQQKKFSQV